MPPRPTTPAAWLAKVRKLCTRLGATEIERWGHPNWTANGRTFAAFEFWKKRWSLAVKSTRGEQAILVQDPRFYVTPYTGAQGWVSAWLDQEPEWDLLATLLEKAHASVVAERPAKTRSSTRSPARKRAARRAPSQRRAQTTVKSPRPMRQSRS